MEKICKNCKKIFFTETAKKIYCCRKCFFKYRRDRMPRKTSKSYFKADALRKLHIPQDQLEIIYGTLLGDSSLILQTNGHYRLSLCHSEKQLPYLLFKKDKLNSIIIQENVNKYIHKEFIINNKLINEKIQYHVHSISHKDLTNLRGIFYRNKKQIITMNVLKLITPTSLLIWYLDDGSINYKLRSISISTHMYSLSEVRTIKKWFWKKHRIITTIHFQKKINEGTEKKYPILHFPVESTKQFISLISTSLIFKELPECMQYKFIYRPYISK